MLMPDVQLVPVTSPLTSPAATPSFSRHRITSLGASAATSSGSESMLHEARGEETVEQSDDRAAGSSVLRAALLEEAGLSTF